MNIKKKFTAALAAGLMVLPFGTVSLTAEGAFNPNKDPNGDGSLDIADAIYISQYLIGYHEPVDLSELDVDCNDIVSVVDKIYVQMYEAGSISGNIGNISSPDVVTQTISRSYNVYSSDDNSYLRNYTLSVNQISNNITNHRITHIFKSFIVVMLSFRIRII